MAPMTPRARVVAALNHQEPDCVPLDLGTGGNTSAVPEAYQNLTAYLGLPASAGLLPHTLRLARMDEAVLQALDIDTRPVYMRPARRGARPAVQPQHVCDDFGVVWKEVDTGAAVYRELAENPLAHATIDDLDDYPWWPDPLDPDRYIVQNQATFSVTARYGS